MSAKIKVTHIVWSLATGGVETMLVNIINEQVKYIKVQLIIVNDKIEQSLISKISNSCIIVKTKRKPGSRNYFDLIKINMHLLSFSPNIIHLHSTNLSKLIFGKWCLVRTIHNTHNPTEEYPRMKALYAISCAVKDYTEKQGFHNVTVVENGISTDSFRKKKSFHVDFYNLVQVSRLYKVSKGQHLMLKALNILVNERKVCNFHMSFIGDGPSRNEYEQMVKDYKLVDFVTFEGNKTQDYLSEHLCDYDVAIQPSTHEGFGLTVAEAIAARVPVLVSDIEGPMEIIDNGKFGMYFKKGDIVDLADKLEHILKGGYNYNMINPSYNHVKTHYDVSITAKNYLEEYKKVLAI